MGLGWGLWGAWLSPEQTQANRGAVVWARVGQGRGQQHRDVKCDRSILGLRYRSPSLLWTRCQGQGSRAGQQNLKHHLKWISVTGGPVIELMCRVQSRSKSRRRFKWGKGALWFPANYCSQATLEMSRSINIMNMSTQTMLLFSKDQEEFSLGNYWQCICMYIWREIQLCIHVHIFCWCWFFTLTWKSVCHSQ